MTTKKTGIYKKWKERAHKKVSLKGIGDDSAEGAGSSAGKFFIWAYCSVESI